MAPTTAQPPADHVRQLLEALDDLPYAARCGLARDTARHLAETGELTGVLTELWAMGRDGRETALSMAVAVGDTAFLAAALRAPEPDLARWAMRAAAKSQVPDDTLAELLDDAPHILRAELYRAIRRGRRTALADRLVGEVAARYGPTEAAALLPACSPAAVAATLPGLPPTPALSYALARRTPGLVLDAADRELSGLPASLRTAWWQRHGGAVGACAEALPLRVLDLLERHTQRGSWPWGLASRLHLLVRADARRTVDALLRAGAARPNLSRGVAYRIVTAAPPNLTAFGRAVRDDEARFAALLRAFPPSAREEFFDAVHADIDMSYWELAEDVLELLPGTRRVAEARRMLAEAEREDDTEARQQWLAHLPYDEARAELLAECGRPDAYDRASGYRALIACAARTRDPRRFAAALTDDLDRVRKDQDPVRFAVVDALDDVPRWLFTADAAEALNTLTHHAFEAVDLSWATRTTLQSLAADLLRQESQRASAAQLPDEDGRLVDWAIGTLAQPAGSREFWVPNQRVRGIEARLVEALLPIVRAAADRRDYEPALALARQLGRHGRPIAPLQELLGEAVRHGDARTVSSAATFWLADPTHRDARTAQVLDADPSAITLRPVLDAVLHRRTDLIDRFLTGAAPQGRFSPASDVWVPRIGRETAHLLPRQREAYARLAAAQAAHPALPADQRAAWLADLAHVPGAGRPLVLPHLDSPDTLVRDAALGGLARVEGHAEALPVLLARVGGDDAHVAMYAASRVSRYVAPSQLGPLLDALLTAPGTKVTVRKEAVRLLIERGVPDGVDRVADAATHDNVHRDVLRAALVALLARLDRPSAWAVVERSVTGPRDVATVPIAVHPLALAEGHRARFAALVVTRCGHEHAAVRRSAYQAFTRWSPWAPGEVERVHGAVRDLSVRKGWKDAAEAIQGLVRDGSGADEFLATADVLADAALAEADGPLDAAAGRDRPATQRLRHLVKLSRAWARQQPDAAAAEVRRFAEHLADRRGFPYEGVQLLAEAVPLHGDADLVTTGLRAVADRCADSPLLAFRAGRRLRARVSDYTAPVTPDELLAPAAALAADRTAAAGLLALALVAETGPLTGWAAEWRGLVRELRAHPAPDVRNAARAIATSRE
ncbi:hypothetical protein [Yinghuangia sp. YIM S09857]|uniref:hypothetical protein n=1 Tax=Yinghuangia sp. YIM S09857 TaxID=3436929 RepID=UPI003F53E480